MSTLARPSPAVVRMQHIVTIGLTAILILTSLVLIASAILTIVSSTIKDKNAIQADLIPVVRNSITPIAVPTSPITNIRPSSSKTFTPIIVGTNKSPVLPVPVPTPPFRGGA